MRDEPLAGERSPSLPSGEGVAAGDGSGVESWALARPDRGDVRASYLAFAAAVEFK